MFKTDLRHSLAICCLAILPAGVAQALPVYTGNTAASNGYSPPVLDLGTTSAPATYAATGAGGTASSVSLGSAGGAVESTAQSADPSPYYVNNTSAYTSLSYRVNIVPLVPTAPPGAIIPIHIVASGSASGADLDGHPSYDAVLNASAQFEVVLNNGAAIPINQEVSSTGYGPPNTFNVDQIVDFSPTDYFDVYLIATAEAGGSGSDAAYAHAMVDPTFTIDPAFASFYELVGIPDDVPITPPGPPTTDVPEPSTWLLFLSGLGMLGIVGRSAPQLVLPVRA